MADKLLLFLRRVCVAYDCENGTWPMSDLEGRSVYAFALEQLGQKMSCEESETWEDQLPSLQKKGRR